jgi:putative component of toxin-antitoxin plasmid stabilization module
MGRDTACIGQDGERIIVLLGGGTKQRQQRDIDAARNAWRDYRNRRSGMRQQEK